MANSDLKLKSLLSVANDRILIYSNYTDNPLFFLL
jgi:hypothetical protein